MKVLVYKAKEFEIYHIGNTELSKAGEISLGFSFGEKVLVTV
jgi:hypothetical protein